MKLQWDLIWERFLCCMYMTRKYLNCLNLCLFFLNKACYFRMSVLGTITYLSPEAISEQKCSKGMDVWSFGMTLWEMLTGRPPYQEYSRPCITWKVLF